MNAHRPALLAAVLLVAGCNNFVSSYGPNGLGEKTYEYDERLTDAMEEVVQTCRPEFDMKPGFVNAYAYVPSTSGCPGVLSYRGQLVYAPITQHLPADALDPDLGSIQDTVTGMPFHPYARFDWESDVELGLVTLHPVSTEWVVTNAGDSALRFVFSFGPTLGTATFSYNDCETSCTWSTGICTNVGRQACLDALDTIPTSAPILSAADTELIVDFIVRPVPTTPGLAVDVDATIAASSVRIGVFFVPGSLAGDWWSDLLLVHYAINDHLENVAVPQLETDFEQALQPIAYKIQTLLQKPIPSTEWITEVGTSIEGGLRIKARVNSKGRSKKGR